MGVAYNRNVSGVYSWVTKTKINVQRRTYSLLSVERAGVNKQGEREDETRERHDGTSFGTGFRQRSAGSESKAGEGKREIVVVSTKFHSRQATVLVYQFDYDGHPTVPEQDAHFERDLSIYYGLVSLLQIQPTALAKFNPT